MKRISEPKDKPAKLRTRTAGKSQSKIVQAFKAAVLKRDPAAALDAIELGVELTRGKKEAANWRAHRAFHLEGMKILLELMYPAHA